MLTEKEILSNKECFISLIESIEREGVDKERLIKKLESSDFFYAPASTIYHSSFEGGLCSHSISVYNTLLNLVKAMYTKYSADDEAYENNCPYSDDTLKIVALFHDFDKMNKYEKTVRRFILKRVQRKTNLGHSTGLVLQVISGRIVPSCSPSEHMERTLCI